jgi:phage FluMu protein Com
MVRCSKCGFEVKENYCTQCGTPVKKVEKAVYVNLVCPKCKSRSQYEIMRKKSLYEFYCNHCNKQFSTLIVQIRAKKSRGSKKDNKRFFSIRFYYLSGGEDFIEFSNANYEDFEIRARDIVAFSSYKNQLVIVQNCTVDHYYEVSNPGCFIATCLFNSQGAEVRMLRQFRDTVLLQSKFLSPLVSIYYEISPLVVKVIEDKESCKNWLKVLFGPILHAVKWYMDE